jgi:hypothetical protein
MSPRPSSSANRPALRVRTIAAPAPAALLLVLAAAGCASPGPPRAPSLNLAQPVTDLTAQRVGDQVLLHWTTAGKTTENLPLSAKTAASLTARICRTPVPPAPSIPPNPAPPCTPALRVPVKPGAGTATDTLPPVSTADPVALLRYTVEIENAAGRSAGPSNAVLAPTGTAPLAIAGLRAAGIPSGTMLEWNSAPGTVELDRTDITPKPPAPPVTTPTQVKEAARPSTPIQLAGQPATTVHLRAPTKSQSSNQPDQPGQQQGTTDQTARFDRTYTYTAQRVRTIEINGYPYELRSQPSAPITVALRDTFPPTPPRGLDAIPGQLRIDLSWQANTETDLAGYYVYRQVLSDSGVPTAAPVRITITPVAGPAYSDSTAARGQRYNYSVTAIDTSGNESRPSPEIEETLS